MSDAIIGEIGATLRHIPTWASALSVLFVALSASISLPFALMQVSIIDWIKCRIWGIPMPTKHMACRHLGDVKTHTELYGAWVKIRDNWKYLYVREAMDMGERTLELMAVELKNRFLAELATHTNVNQTAQKTEYDKFCLMLCRFTVEMKDRFRAYARENGYYAMSEREFKDYLDIKPRTIIGNASEIFDLYHSSMLVSRARLREITNDFMPEVFKLTVQCFEYARLRSIYWNTLRHEKYDEWAKAHSVIYGKEPTEKVD